MRFTYALIINPVTFLVSSLLAFIINSRAAERLLIREGQEIKIPPHMQTAKWHACCAIRDKYWGRKDLTPAQQKQLNEAVFFILQTADEAYYGAY